MAVLPEAEEFDIELRNEDIRREYNWLRVQIARVLRDIDALEHSSEEDRDILALDELKVEFEANNAIATGELDGLIRTGRISAGMAASLMNDIGYARNAIWHLTDVARALYGAKDTSSKGVENLLSLTKDEVDDLRRGQSEG